MVECSQFVGMATSQITDLRVCRTAGMGPERSGGEFRSPSRKHFVFNGQAHLAGDYKRYDKPALAV